MRHPVLKGALGGACIGTLGGVQGGTRGGIRGRWDPVRAESALFQVVGEDGKGESKRESTSGKEARNEVWLCASLQTEPFGNRRLPGAVFWREAFRASSATTTSSWPT